MTDPTRSENVGPIADFLGDNDEPLDQDVDDNAMDSAEADEQAAREGTLDEPDDRI